MPPASAFRRLSFWLGEMNQKIFTRGAALATAMAVVSAVAFYGSKSNAWVLSHYLHETTQGEKPFDQAAALADLSRKIAGQETKPAGEVFKNIQILKGMPAGRVLKVMEFGYARSLGVNCTHCHVVGEWEKDDKPAKQIARDMVAMSNTINSDLLNKIKNLKGPNAIVNCTTCHRGQVKPVLNLPDTPPKS